MANDIDLNKAYLSILTRFTDADTEYLDRIWLNKAYVSMVTRFTDAGTTNVDMAWLNKAYISILTRFTDAPFEASFVSKMYATAVYRDGTGLPSSIPAMTVLIF